MENTILKRRLPPALPYALDYLGLVLLSAWGSIAWFYHRLGTLLLAIPLGCAFTLLASLLFYRWQRSRWEKRCRALERRAMALYLSEDALADTPEAFRARVKYLLTRRGFSPMETGTRLVYWDEEGPVRVFCLRHHPETPVGAQQLLLPENAARSQGQRLLAVSSAPFSEAARTYARNRNIALAGPDTLAEWAEFAGLPLPPREKARYLALARAQEPRRARSLEQRLAGMAALRYGLGAVLLALLGLTAPFRGWYWLGALFCAVMALALALMPRRSGRS